MNDASTVRHSWRLLNTCAAPLFALLVALVCLGSDASALDANDKLAAKIAKLEAKIDVAAAKQSDVEADLAQTQSDLSAAQIALGAAQALPETTPEEAKAKKKAVGSAKKAHKKATKRVAKLSKRVGKLIVKQGKLAEKISMLDPGGDEDEVVPPVVSASAGVEQVIVSWSNVSDAVGYKLMSSTEDGADLAVDGAIVDGVSSPYTHTGLVGGVPITYAVAAVMPSGALVASAVVSVTPVPLVTAPENLTAIAGIGVVTFTWDETTVGATHTLHWSVDAGASLSDAPSVQDVESPYVLAGLTPGVAVFAVVTAKGSVGPKSQPSNVASATPLANEASSYDPEWATVTPVLDVVFNHDPGLNDKQNGNALRTAVNGLQPGHRLLIGDGRYEFLSPLSIEVSGTLDDPIWIEAAPGAAPLLERADIDAGLVTVGTQGSTPASRYVAIRGLELVGGDVALRVHKATQIWIDDMHMHDTGGGVVATTEHADNLHITRNHIHDTVSWGEGIKLGQTTPNRRVTESVVALNHIHDTTAATQGDGIDIKWQSHSNWIVGNIIHHTKYPCIIFLGTQGNPINVFERNVAYHSEDNVMQAEAGDALVLNNLLVGPAGNKVFDSSHNKSDLENLYVVHNTLWDEGGRGAGLYAWDGQPNLVFANNVIYVKTVSSGSFAIAYTDIYSGGTLSGNMILGPVKNGPTGYTTGIGLTDFVNVPNWGYTYDSPLDFRPSPTGALIGSGDHGYAVGTDITGQARELPLEPGCFDG